MAKGAKDRGRIVAFGDGKRIIWDHHSEQIFRGNPNILRAEHIKDHLSTKVDWIPFHRGNRLYNSLGDGCWIWNYDFRAQPGEFYFDAKEQKFAACFKPGLVIIEPNVPDFKSVAPNKQWPVKRYQAVADALLKDGQRVAQFAYGRGVKLQGVRQIATPTFRHAAAVMSRASLYIGPEGGLHHAAAAVGIPAVVLFGGFIPPQVTGYDTHTNLTGGAEACGSLHSCEHCRLAMKAIGVDEVLEASRIGCVAA